MSSHPLFPAIVALWFGALFGLGSLAIRPSLLESLIISSHIDAIVPMAAPPLGMTARILLAVALAVFGIALGAMLARRIARPKQTPAQRRRNPGGVVGNAKASFSAMSGAARAQREAETDEPAPARRRPLAVEQDETERYHYDAAPLPGSAPGIFDITQFDLSAPEAADDELETPFEAEQPLELTGSVPQGHSLGAEANLASTAPAEEFSGLAATEHEEFGMQPETETAPFDFAAGLASDFAPVSFDPEPEIAAEPAPLRRFDAASPQSSVVPQPVADVPAMTTYADQREAEPVVIEVESSLDVLRRFDSPGQSSVMAQQDSALPAAEPIAEEAPVLAAAPLSEPGLPLPKGSAAARIASANLAELSPVELIERFALALQQRRHLGAMPEGLAAAVASFDLPASPEPSPPVNFSFALPAFSAPPVSEIDRIAAFNAPTADSGFEQVAVVESFAYAPSPLTLPAALRPIDFGDFEDADDEHGYVPQRSMAMPVLAEAELSLDVAGDDAAPVDDNQAEVESEVEAEVEVCEDNYSSLLDLNRPAPLRQPFVRIEEPEGDDMAVEPVVIFPGQNAREGTRFARPTAVSEIAEIQTGIEPVPAFVPEAGSNLRRFDAPSAVAAAPTSKPVATQDPEEAERALRSALATLQRMSGAA